MSDHPPACPSQMTRWKHSIRKKPRPFSGQGLRSRQAGSGQETDSDLLGRVPIRGLARGSSGAMKLLAGCAGFNRHGLLGAVAKYGLFGEDQFPVFGNSKMVFFTGMNDEQFRCLAQQLTTGDPSSKRHNGFYPSSIANIEYRFQLIESSCRSRFSRLKSLSQLIFKINNKRRCWLSSKNLVGGNNNNRGGSYPVSHPEFRMKMISDQDWKCWPAKNGILFYSVSAT